MKINLKHIRVWGYSLMEREITKEKVLKKSNCHNPVNTILWQLISSLNTWTTWPNMKLLFLVWKLPSAWMSTSFLLLEIQICWCIRFKENKIWRTRRSRRMSNIYRSCAKDILSLTLDIIPEQRMSWMMPSPDEVKALRLIEHIHAGVCVTHMNTLTFSTKILRAVYFWITMEHDCCKYVHKFHKCLVHRDDIRMPPHELNVISSTWPFVDWATDVIGQINPSASNGHKFILVAIDFFTKWVEAASYKSMTKKVLADFVRNNLICRFGVLESIINGNGENLNSNLMRDICEKFKITHWNSTVFRPLMNRVVQAATKNIKNILRKIIDNYRGWNKMFPHALLGYRITIRTSIGSTPYFLVYGTKAVIPAEVEIPSLRIIHED